MLVWTREAMLWFLSLDSLMGMWFAPLTWNSCLNFEITLLTFLLDQISFLWWNFVWIMSFWYELGVREFLNIHVIVRYESQELWSPYTWQIFWDLGNFMWTFVKILSKVHLISRMVPLDWSKGTLLVKSKFLKILYITLITLLVKIIISDKALTVNFKWIKVPHF